MADFPHPPVVPPPWHLTGEAVALLASWRSVRLLVHYHTSPVGPYIEHAIATLTAHGPSVIRMGVTSEASMRGGRENWGYPKVVERLLWTDLGGRITFRRGPEAWRVRPFGPRVPFVLPIFTVQEREGQLVRVPGKLSGRARLGWRGRQLAIVLEDFSMEIAPPRTPH